jgi:putative peptidoglycan lipid II flippase
VTGTGTRPDGPSNRVAANSLSIAVWTLASRVTGVGKIVAISSVLGPTYLGNTFLATNLVPNLAYEFLTGTLIASLLVPVLVRALDEGGPGAAQRLASGFMGAMTIFFLAITAAVVAAGPLVLRVLAVGVDDPAVAADQRRVGWLLLALFMPQVVFYGIAGIGAAAMNASGRFALAAGAPLVENLGIVATLAVYAAVYGSRPELATIPLSHLLLLGGGTTASVAAHAAVQWWGARRAGITLTFRPGWRQPEVREVLRRSVPSCAYAGLNAVRTFAALVVANRVAGGVVAFQLALNFFHLPVALGAKPVTVATLPLLSQLAVQRAWASFRQELRSSLGLVLFLTVPAAVGYAVLAEPLARVVSFGEMAAGGGAALVAAALAALALGVVGEGVFLLGTEAAYARHRPGAALRSMAVRAAVSLVLMAGAFALDPGPMLLAALGAAISAGNIVGAWHLLARVRRDLPADDERWATGVVRAALASVAMAVPAVASFWAVSTTVSGRGGDLVGIAAAALSGIVTYLAIQWVLRAPEIQSFRVAFAGRVRHG